MKFPKGSASQIVFGIGPGILLLSVFFMLFAMITGSLFWSSVLGIAVSATLYFLYIFPYVTIEVPANKGWLIANTWKHEVEHRDPNFAGYRKIVAQRELQAGLYWIYPWEKKTPNEVDMQRKIYVKHDEDEIYTLKDGKKYVRIKYLITIVPLSGYLVNFIKTDEEDIKKKVKARVEGWLQGKIGSLDSATYGQAFIDSLKADFNALYGGPGATHADEIELGIWTGAPEITDIDPPKEAQKARIEQETLNVDIESAQQIVDKSGGKVSLREALALIYRLRAAQSGNAALVDVGNIFAAGQQKLGKGKGGKTPP